MTADKWITAVTAIVGVIFAILTFFFGSGILKKSVGGKPVSDLPNQTPIKKEERQKMSAAKWIPTVAAIISAISGILMFLFGSAILEKSVSSITIASNPSKTSYYVGESLNTSGLELNVTYSNGSTETISSGFTCSPTTLDTTGTQAITVSYGGKNTSFAVTVDSRRISSTTMSNDPEMISVANVVGKSLFEAKTNLTDQGFCVASSEEYSSHPSGNVIRQSPSAGSPLEKGGTVSVVISKGKQPVIVSFNAMGGAVSLSSKTVYVSDPYGELPTPSMNAFVFVGWFTESGEGVSNATTVSNTNDHTLYAHWEEVIPSYLSYYSAPSSLGSDLHKPIVSIEGDLYYFPCPVRAFLKNGWSGDNLDDIEDNTYNFSLTLTRNGKTLHLGNVSNHWTDSTTVRNCVVEGITIDNDPSEAWNSSINIYLPNNISHGTSREYVMSVLPSDFKKDTDTYGRVFYRYTMSNPFGHIIITMDQTNSYVVEINVCKSYN